MKVETQKNRQFISLNFGEDNYVKTENIRSVFGNQSTLAGYEELAGGFEPIGKRKVF